MVDHQGCRVEIVDYDDVYGVGPMPRGFGRGWIPAGRDIGLADQLTLSGGGSAPSPLPFTEGARGGVCGPDAPDGDMPHPNPSPEAEGLSLRASAHNGWTPERQARFLDHLSWNGNVRAACALVGLSAEAAYKLRRRDARFAQGWATAVVLARAQAEQVLADRALNGVSEPIFYRGEQVGARLRFDTRLLLAHLARLDRQAEEIADAVPADRFDELLAVIAGARPGDLLAGDDASGLPPPRESFVARAGEAAEQAAARRLYEADDEDDAEDWREDEGDGEDRRREDRGVGADDAENCGPETCGEEDQAGEEEEEEEADWRDPILAAGRAARADAATRWDLWRAEAQALVDRVGAARSDISLRDGDAREEDGGGDESGAGEHRAAAFAPSTLSTVSTCPRYGGGAAAETPRASAAEN